MTTIALKRIQSRTFSFKEWLNAKNGLFSACAGEQVSNRVVLKVGNALAAFLVAVGSAETSAVMCTVALAWFAMAAISLRKEGGLS